MSGIDIVLDTIFNNPALPRVPIYGFYDDFERPDGPIGVTSREAKPWVKFQYPGSDIDAIIENGKLKSTGTTAWNVFAADAKSPNGTFRAVLSNMDRAGGLRVALRVWNATNFLTINFISSGAIRLGLIANGSPITIADSVAMSGLENGVLEVVMDGPSVSVMWNGIQVIAPQAVTDFAGYAHHGFMLRSESPSARVDEVSFRVS